jgi:hypothetical protein
MAYVNTGLPNSGRTDYFVFQYDETLSAGRGRDLARDLMNYVDDDFRLMMGWFSGRGLDMDPPIHVSLDAVATDDKGFPTQTVGAEWQGFLTTPLHVEVYIGELPIRIGTPTMLARSLVVAEVSEMFMRNFSLPHNNPWFTPTNEGNKGEGLSRFLSAKFVRDVYPDAVALPTVRGGSFNVSDLWLNSMRDNFLEVDDGDIDPNEKTGCATLFLFWLHDQLGFGVEEIINAGAGKLSSVYANLTGDSWVNAWPNFSGLVDSHYPHSAKKAFFSPMYDPPFDSVYPVAELKDLDAPALLSWVVNGRENAARVFLTHPLTVNVDVMLSSDDPKTVAVPTSVRTSSSAKVPLTVPKAQSAAFNSKEVTLTASYAGQEISTKVTVVRPGDLPVPPLVIVPVDQDDDPCAIGFLEGGSQEFVVKNAGVITDQDGLVYAWTVSGANAQNTSAPTLTIPSLPAAGTHVSLHLTLRNAAGVHTEGSYSFTTNARRTGLKEELRRFNCALGHLKEINLQIPPDVPIEEVVLPPEQLTLIEVQVLQLLATAETLAASVEKTKELIESPVS